MEEHRIVINGKYHVIIIDEKRVTQEPLKYQKKHIDEGDHYEVRKVLPNRRIIPIYDIIRKDNCIVMLSKDNTSSLICYNNELKDYKFETEDGCFIILLNVNDPKEQEMFRLLTNSFYGISGGIITKKPTRKEDIGWHTK